MVCYARPASRLAAIVIVAWLVFSGPVSHFLDAAALMVAVTVATAGAAVAAALVFATFMSTRRRRAAAGGCVSCQFRCQHAMAGPTRRLWLVTTADRGPQGPEAAPGRSGARGRPGPAPGRSVPVFLPVPAVRSATPAPAAPAAPADGPARARELAAPRWPDRPAHRASQVSHRAPGPPVRAPQRERAGSPALAAAGPGRGRGAVRRIAGDRLSQHGLDGRPVAGPSPGQVPQVLWMNLGAAIMPRATTALTRYQRLKDP
jgi:hypothetical protein